MPTLSLFRRYSRYVQLELILHKINIKRSNSPKVWKICSTKLSPIQPNGILQDCSDWDEGLTQKARSIAARSDAVQICARVKKNAELSLPRRFLMCCPTGEELEAFLARKGVEYDHIAYVGDGSNDFCPILRLRRWVLPFSCRMTC